MKIVCYINGERKVFDDNDASTFEWTNGLLHINCEDGTEYYIFYDAEEAGKAAREYWEDQRGSTLLQRDIWR